jgi:hypothetical protein
MARRPFLLAVPIAAAVVSLVATAGPALAAETTPAARGDLALSAAPPAAEHVRPLHEMRTPQNSMFYTMSDNEAKQAEEIHGFTPSGEAKGLGLFNKRVEGTTAVYRLRTVKEPRSFILVTNEKELKKLLEDTTDAWEFTLDGVIGHIATKPSPGTVAVHRFSKKNDWRLARATRVDLLVAGYDDDGLLGYAPTTRHIHTCVPVVTSRGSAGEMRCARIPGHRAGSSFRRRRPLRVYRTTITICTALVIGNADLAMLLLDPVHGDQAPVALAVESAVVIGPCSAG